MGSQFEGLIAAVHSPFDDRDELRLESVESQANWLMTSDVRGVYVCGTTGESTSLAITERRQLLERWVEIAQGKLRIIAHVGHHSLPEAVALARHAQDTGADAVSAIAPGFLKPSNVQTLVEWCALIAQAAPDRPFYYYHSPGMTGCTLPLNLFIDAAQERIPTFAGVKFNDNDLSVYQAAFASHDGTLDVPFGVDESLLAGLACGAASFIGSTYNYAAPHFYRLIRAYQDGDMALARRLAQQSIEMIDLLKRYGVLAAGKALMKLRGVECGSPRLPLASLSRSQEQELLEAAMELPALQTEPVGAM